MILAIAAGLCGGIFAAALASGLMEHRFATSIEQHISHIQIHNPDYITDNILSNNIEGYTALASELSGDENIIAFSPRMATEGMIASANITRGINIIGIYPEKEARVSGLDRNIVSGDYLVAEDRNRIVVGMSLAERQNLRPGSRVVLTFQQYDGELVAEAFRVAGIYQTGNSLWDENTVYINTADIIALAEGTEPVNEIAIIATDAEKAVVMSEEYSAKHTGLSVRSWQEIAPELSYLHGMAGIMLRIVLGIILLALAFGLVNTMLMAIFERASELGVLMAVGMGKRRIVSMIMLETAFLTFCGAVTGMAAGALLITLTGFTGIDLAVVGGDALNEFGFPSVVYPALSADFFRDLTILVVVTAIGTALYPALKAIRLNPAEAVKTI